jgi:hypothetical protein
MLITHCNLVFPQAGWTFTATTDPVLMNILGGGHGCALDKLHFWSSISGEATLSATLTGSGSATIRFSQCWDSYNSVVGVYLDGAQIARTVSDPNIRGPSPEVVLTFSYTDGQVLAIKDIGGSGTNAVAQVCLYFLDQSNGMGMSMGKSMGKSDGMAIGSQARSGASTVETTSSTSSTPVAVAAVAIVGVMVVTVVVRRRSAGTTDTEDEEVEVVEVEV